MTNDQVRFVANKMMLAVEWLDLHVTTRRPADRAALAYKLDDLRKGLLKLMATHMRTPSLPGNDGGFGPMPVRDEPKPEEAEATLRNQSPSSNTSA